MGPHKLFSSPVDYIPLYNSMVEEISHADCPEILYKYMSLDAAIAAVEGLTLCYTPPKDFDDIFELFKIGTVSHEDGKTVNPISAFMRAIQESDVLTKLSESIGVSCFSDKSTINTMWSLYADHHKGIVIGYKSEYLFPLSAVRYVSTEEEEEDFSSNVQNAQYMIFTKTNDWAWQREYRSIERLDNLKKSGQKHIKILPKDAIAEIYIGAMLNEVYNPPNEKVFDFNDAISRNCKNVSIFACMKHLTERGRIDIVPVQQQ